MGMKKKLLSAVLCGAMVGTMMAPIATVPVSYTHLYIGHDQVEIHGEELPVRRGMKDTAVAKLAECMLKGIG